ncbi:hypothetical protein CKAN_02651200 [Cinnamomum micranthum f. kanehirae]|uniref:DUF7026 domain-containing protein n=1 Tax=Cinnamomum micranthum f. kanehirae TaxID=337451 RepID=A0A3S3NYU9_9MAGN|nr:hypothetical protein CKAN_02651200 [Cinnamomum micranthum f. kanehirae]
MAIRASLFTPQILPKQLKSPKQPNPVTPLFLLQNRNRARKSHLCFSSSSSSSNRPIDADLPPELSSELASEVARIKGSLLQREKAMKKSRETLFVDLCQYLGLGAEEAKKRWREMGEEERLECLRMFVADWGLSFHPLSLKSVKEMVDEHLAEETPPPTSASSFSFPDFRRMMNFS